MGSYLRLCIVFALAAPVLPARADMSVRDMAGATDAVRAAAQAIVQYEMCGVNSSEIISMLLDHASECDASETQMAKLQSTYDQEVSSHKSLLKQQGLQCQWSLPQAQAQFNKMKSNLQEKMRSSGCN
ncbi:MAG TPA: hypothetical protein VKR55_09155 [Bradyrhizobium sp.]|uniref:hypothetical protein n=1 Tax=Bradyrhizobium sp. TaxID=376 RepID=UPI002C55546D|nr:hypothetical protein [Bradyrhizobium sp.]HLZ02306.1 hypothetical protein [Bradyrhizobium sp.]